MGDNAMISKQLAQIMEKMEVMNAKLDLMQSDIKALQVTTKQNQATINESMGTTTFTAAQEEVREQTKTVLEEIREEKTMLQEDCCGDQVTQAPFKESCSTRSMALCGDQFQNSCRRRNVTGGVSSKPSAIPAIPVAKTKLTGTTVGSISNGTLILLLTLLLLTRLLRRRQRSISKREERRNKAVADSDRATEGGTTTTTTSDRRNKRFSCEKGSGEEEGTMGTLVFLDITAVRYSMADLLNASAEPLGRGTLGSTYKAEVESGFIVTVKRLKEAAGFTRMEELKRRIEIIGRLKHPNLVPLRAYFQDKEECMLVYDYFPNGSLFSLIHGRSRVSGSGKPLHWTSCLKIAEDLATGLVYIHQNPNLAHGNLKPSNVLLGPDFETCLTDYCLRDLQDSPDSVAASLFYKAPEFRGSRKASTQPADVYSFGVLLLELLTGKTSFHAHGSDISRWVRGAEITESNEEKLEALLSIAMTCVAIQPEKRPVMRDVLKMVKDARAEAAVLSSYSSDHMSI